VKINPLQHNIETLDKLTKEIHDVATTGILPDGDGVESVVVMLWFEAWADKLTDYRMYF